MVAGLPKSQNCRAHSLTAASSEEAKAKVQALALRVVADRLEHGEAGTEFESISFNAA